MNYQSAPYWSAPEDVISGRKNIVSVNICSLGCIAIELSEGRPPYYEFDHIKAMLEIQSNGFSEFRKSFHHSIEFTNFVKSYFICDREKHHLELYFFFDNDSFIKSSEILSKKK